jgi:GDPmannose 4,6-dehydratase
MKSIIFGVNGQDGYYLTNLLALNGIDVIGVSRGVGNWIKGDVTDLALVEALISTQQPDYVFHFAAHSTTRHSALFANHQAISTGTLNILESVKLHCAKARVFLSGSAMQFENRGLPISEKTPFDAKSPYAVARIQSTYAGRYYRQAFSLNVYLGYLFNHDSPMRTEQHVNKKITAAINRIANGSNEKLELGNLEVRKEFNYAGDVVEAIWRLVNQDAVFEAVIGSGDSHSIREWTEYCFAKVNKNWADFVEVRKDFVPEYQALVSNPVLIKSLGWEPKVTFCQLADMMLEAQ